LQFFAAAAAALFVLEGEHEQLIVALIAVKK
jgi:hypothetical protein